jgi:hypothetical protein
MDRNFGWSSTAIIIGKAPVKAKMNLTARVIVEV